MAFAFNFNGDDIEVDGPDHDVSVIEAAVKQYTIDEPGKLIPPKKHTLEDLLRDMPSQISYNLVPITNNTGAAVLNIARRSVFDIRTQLMAEAIPDENDNDALLAGLDRGDLTSGVYEGGFKTWECALDLAGLLMDLKIEKVMHIIEIGAGSAIPSLTLLRRILDNDADPQMPNMNVSFTLCDYNEDVLRLATAPNIFLTQQVRSDEASRSTSDHDMEIEDIDESKISSSCKTWESSSTTFNFVSGAWGTEFMTLVNPAPRPNHATSAKTLILASETIYSPTSTKIFADTLMQLLRQDPANTRAWIAAKVIYFGVGGGVEDFVNEIRQRDGRVTTIFETKGAGVGRVVLEVTADETSD